MILAEVARARDETTKAAQRARQFAVPLLRVESGFQRAVLSAHLAAIRAMRPVIEAGGTPGDAGRIAFSALYPALVKLGRLWFPRALREGWAQGNARLRAAVSRRRKSWSDDTALKAPSKPKPSKPKPDITTIFDLEWPEIAEYIATRPIAYAPIAAQTTVDMFRAQLVAGADQGLGIEGIVRNILGEQLPGISRWRATVIARTEVLRAGSRASMASYRASGVVQRKTWISTRDARTRESHRTQSWKAGSATVPLDQPFVLPSGARLLHPGDQSYGASLSEIVACRCAVAPSVSLPGIPDFAPNA